MSNDKQIRPRIGPSFCAVVAAIVAGILVTIMTDIALHAAGAFPPRGQPIADGPHMVATVDGVVHGIGVGYTIAPLTSNRPMLHAFLGGAFGVLASTAGAAVRWNGGPEFEAHGYPVALIVAVLPRAWLLVDWRYSPMRDI
jgi:hypothetical protein